MAHDKSTRAKLRAKYVQGADLATAASVCKVAYNTARNWKKQDRDDGNDWDIARNAKLISRGGIEEMANEVLGSLAEQFLVTLQAVKDDPKMKAADRADILIRLMDGYNKAIGAASRAMPNANRLAVAMEVLKFFSETVRSRFPKFRTQFIEIIESVGEDFAREFGTGA